MSGSVGVSLLSSKARVNAFCFSLHTGLNSFCISSFAKLLKGIWPVIQWWLQYGSGLDANELKVDRHISIHLKCNHLSHKSQAMAFGFSCRAVHKWKFYRHSESTISVTYALHNNEVSQLTLLVILLSMQIC